MQSIFQNGHGIGVVRPETFSQDTAQTPGSHRVAAITREHGTPSSMWGGLFTVAPGGQTAIHHHGKQDTVVYILAGTCLIRWGRHGEFSATAQSGDFVYVPAYLPHKEINLSEDTEFTWVVVRSTPEPIVVNLPDQYWSGGQANGSNYGPTRQLEDSSYV
jgi:uncharacterized RmlC-like cupin family protein